MLIYKYQDDGYYMHGFYIFEEDGSRYAETQSEVAAREIVDAVNTARLAATDGYVVMPDGARLPDERDK